MMPVEDLQVIRGIVDRNGVKTVLEWGPGDSTEMLLDAGCHVTSLEHDPHWFDVACERFPCERFPDLELILYAWPHVDDIPAIQGRSFDMVLVDGPSSAEYKDPYHFFRLETIRASFPFSSLVVIHDARRESINESLQACGFSRDDGEMFNTPNGVLAIKHTRNVNES